MIRIPITLDFDSDIKLSNGAVIRTIKPDEFLSFFDKKSVEFNKGKAISIKPANSPNFYSHWNNYHKLNYIGKELINGMIPQFLIEHTEQNELNNVLLSMRLLSDINFYSPIGFEENSIHFFDCSFSQRNVLNLKSLDLHKLNQLCEKFGKNSSAKLKLLIERFRHVTNEDLSDKIRFVESISIIESIVSGNDKNELRFRFSLYSSFISNQYEFKEIRELYDIRSQLVHTGKSKDFNKEKLKKAISLCKELFIQFVLNAIDGENILKTILIKLKTKHNNV